MEEIIPGVFHWTAAHPDIGKEVSSYYLAFEATLLDPLIPEEGLDWFKGRQLSQIVLTNRYHTRDSARFREAFDCRIWVSRPGIELGVELDDPEPYDFGQTLPGGIVTVGVEALSPDDGALFLERSGGIAAFADGLVRKEDGQIGFVDDELLADSPEEVGRVKANLQFALQSLMARRDFEHILFAHGDPMVGSGKALLRRFLDEQAADRPSPL